MNSKQSNNWNLILLFLGSTRQTCCVYRSTATAFLKSELALCLGEADIFRWVPPRQFYLHPESLISRAEEASPNGLTWTRKKYTCPRIGVLKKHAKGHSMKKWS